MGLPPDASGDSLRKSIRRSVRKQLDNALEELTGEQKDQRDEAVHEVRKSFNKIRAVLRLVRPAIGDKSYRRENTCFRDAARPVTEVRDARILIETLDKLLEHFQAHVANRSFADIRKALQNELRAVRKRVLDEHNAFVVVAETVSQARERVKRWTDVPDKWSSVGTGLRDACRQARAPSGTRPAIRALRHCTSGASRSNTCATSSRSCGPCGLNGWRSWPPRRTGWATCLRTTMTWRCWGRC